MNKNYIQYIRRKNQANRRRKVWKNFWILPLICFAIAAALSLFYFDTAATIKPLISKDGLWQEVIANDRPKLILLGDIVLYTESKIKNSIQEDNSVVTKKRTNLKSPNNHNPHEFVTAESLEWTQNLTAIFSSIQSDFNFNTVSKFDTDQLNTHDVIVVGVQKNLNLFQSYWTPSKIKYDGNQNSFYIDSNKPINSSTYGAKGNSETLFTDYSYIAKLPGVNNNNIYIFSGISDVGTTQSLRTFTDARMASKLETQLQQAFDTIPGYFEVLLEVNTLKNEESNSEILHMFRIKH